MGSAGAEPLFAEARRIGEQMAAAARAAGRRREVIRQLHEGGWSIRAIAGELNVSASAVAQALRLEPSASSSD